MREPSPGRTRLSQGGMSTTPQHALTFRVMRLTSVLPCRTNPPPLVPIPIDESGGIEDATLIEASDTSEELLQYQIPPWEAEGSPCGVGHLTVLPSSFGSIYASETFRSFISVFNRSAEAVRNVAVGIHMQTASSRRIPLFDSSSDPRSRLHSRGSINNIVSVVLPELGVHVLVCSATYEDSSAPPTAPPRTLRQFFRFNVLRPLDPAILVLPVNQPFHVSLNQRVSTHVTDGNNGHYLVHLRLHNAIPLHIYDTAAKFTPCQPFQVSTLALSDVAVGNERFRPRRVTMASGDMRNFIFHVFSSSTGTPAGNGSATFDHPLLAAKPSSISALVSKRALGKVTVTWRSATGEHGRLEEDVKADEPREAPPPVHVAIYAVPHEIRAHRPFIARCAARNNTNKPLRLYLQVRRDLVGEVVPVGVSGLSLGEVAPSNTVRCALTLIPLVRGQHNISGVRVVDIDSNASYKAQPPIVTVT